MFQTFGLWTWLTYLLHKVYLVRSSSIGTRQCGQALKSFSLIQDKLKFIIYGPPTYQKFGQFLKSSYFNEICIVTGRQWAWSYGYFISFWSTDSCYWLNSESYSFTVGRLESRTDILFSDLEVLIRIPLLTEVSPGNSIAQDGNFALLKHSEKRMIQAMKIYSLEANYNNFSLEIFLSGH